MKKDKVKPYILNVAEIIYLAIFEIKKSNPELTNIEEIELFIGSEKYNTISSGKFHDDWFNDLKQNDFIECFGDIGVKQVWISKSAIDPNFLLNKGNVIAS